MWNLLDLFFWGVNPSDVRFDDDDTCVSFPSCRYQTILLKHFLHGPRAVIGDG